TTPWTLPSNVAAAVHPDLEYGIYRHPKHPSRGFVMATSREAKLREILGEELALEGTVAGRALAGLEYRRPLDVVPLPEECRHSVGIPGRFVTAEDGSGIVPMGPAVGADDYSGGKEHGLALVRPVAPDGTFSGTTWPEIEGRLVTA